MSRDLAGFAWTLVRTDFKTRYHGTLAGFVWALLKPFTMFLVLLSVFSLIFRQDPNYRLNLIIGLFLWDFFAEGTKVGLTALQAKAYLLSKAKFPAWIMVVASTSNPVITLMVFFVVISIFLSFFGHPPGLASLGLFLLYLLHYFLMVVGFSLGASVLFIRYKDLNQVWEVVSNAGFFLAPVVYPLGILPERVHFYLYVWPPTPIIQFARSVLVSGIVPTFRGHCFLLADTAVILALGIAIFRRYAPTIAEHL